MQGTIASVEPIDEDNPNPYTTPPRRLTAYQRSMLAMKLKYVDALLRWASTWFDRVDDVELEACLEALAEAKRIRRRASRLEAVLEDAAIAEMVHTQTPVHHGSDYAAALRAGRERKGWKHPQVVGDLVDKQVEQASQRFPTIPKKIIRAIVEPSVWIVPKVARIEWRSTDLRDLELDPDNYSTVDSERPSIDLRGSRSYPNPRKGMRRAS